MSARDPKVNDTVYLPPTNYPFPFAGGDFTIDTVKLQPNGSYYITVQGHEHQTYDWTVLQLMNTPIRSNITLRDDTPIILSTREVEPAK